MDTITEIPRRETFKTKFRKATSEIRRLENKIEKLQAKLAGVPVIEFKESEFMRISREKEDLILTNEKIMRENYILKKEKIFLEEKIKVLSMEPGTVGHEKPVKIQKQPINLDELDLEVSNAFGMTVEEFKSNLGIREHKYTIPRFVVMELMAEKGYTYKEITKHLGMLNHTSVVHGRAAHRDMFATYPDYRERFRVVRDKFFSV